MQEGLCYYYYYFLWWCRFVGKPVRLLFDDLHVHVLCTGHHLPIDDLLDHHLCPLCFDWFTCRGNQTQFISGL